MSRPRSGAGSRCGSSPGRPHGSRDRRCGRVAAVKFGRSIAGFRLAGPCLSTVSQRHRNRPATVGPKRLAPIGGAFQPPRSPAGILAGRVHATSSTCLGPVLAQDSRGASRIDPFGAFPGELPVISVRCTRGASLAVPSPGSSPGILVGRARATSWTRSCPILARDSRGAFQIDRFGSLLAGRPVKPVGCARGARIGADWRGARIGTRDAAAATRRLSACTAPQPRHNPARDVARPTGRRARP
jgi:hypothetical protein